jgi:ubiquitin carboxyl-terminal hydrolase 7
MDEEYVGFIRDLNTLFVKMDNGRNSVSPRHFIDTAIGLKWLENETNTPCDALEFLQYLVDRCLDSLQKTSPAFRAISELLMVQARHYTRRPWSADVSAETFLFLPVSIADSWPLPMTLEDGLRELTREVEFDSNNPDGSDVRVRKSTKFTTLPPVLIIQLLRFLFDETTEETIKNGAPVLFPPVLEMDDFLDPGHEHEGSKTYDLFSVIVHAGEISGPLAGGAHYFVFLRGEKIGVPRDCWMKLNDQGVTEHQTIELTAGYNEAPYLLFYVQRAANSKARAQFSQRRPPGGDFVTYSRTE